MKNESSLLSPQGYLDVPVSPMYIPAQAKDMPIISVGPPLNQSKIVKESVGFTLKG